MIAPSARQWPRRLVISGVIAAVALVLAANAHLVHVALKSRPDCVPHLKSEGGGGAFRAARSSC